MRSIALTYPEAFGTGLEIVGFYRRNEMETLLFLHSRLKPVQAVSENRSAGTAACLQESGFHPAM
jgi:hypothetical protein